MITIKKYTTIAFAFLALFTTQVKAQDWEVPANESKVKSSMPFSATTARDGKDLFNTKCKSCHGAAGENASLPLSPEPGDVAGEKFSKQTDGDLFYKITHGRGAMPAFQSQLSDEERWKIISYIRTFHKDYVAEGAGDVAQVDADVFSGSKVNLDVNFSQEAHEAIAKVTGEQDGETVNAKGVRVGFFVKRAFGYMKIGDAITTDENGLAIAKFPSDLPGDSVGNYDVLVKLIDDDLYGKVELSKSVSFGKAFVAENPLDHRAMWGNRSNAPLWLLITYFAVVGLVWATIIWVVLQMMKLKKLA